MEKVLVVDSYKEQTIIAALSSQFEVLSSVNGYEAELVLCGEIISVIVVHQHIFNDDSIEFLKNISQQYPAIPRILISDFDKPDQLNAVIEQSNIFQFISKPWLEAQLRLAVNKAVQLHHLQNTNQLLSHELSHSKVAHVERLAFQKHQPHCPLKVEDIVCADNSPMKKILCELGKIAHYDVSLLITGESGTGKELLARAIHYNSPRADMPFVIENCGAMHEDLLCSELFGHRKGSFTGSTTDHVGLFEKADGGTIFLDEIGETSSSFQVKLLRVLQEGEIRPLGSNITKKVDVRVVAATNRCLKDDMELRRFRPDLYYRLATMQIEVLPLRHRKVDILPIAEMLLEKLGPEFDKPEVQLADETLRLMHHYDWPGNVRELENEIKRMLVLGRGSLLTPDLMSIHIQTTQPSDRRIEQELDLDIRDGQCLLKDHVESLERKLIIQILQQQQWNKSQAANILGLSRVGLTNKIERYEINKESIAS